MQLNIGINLIQWIDVLHREGLRFEAPARVAAVVFQAEQLPFRFVYSPTPSFLRPRLSTKTFCVSCQLDTLHNIDGWALNLVNHH